MIKIKLYSIDELAEKGWKYSESKRVIYIGKIQFPTMSFNTGLTHLLGKEFDYEGSDERGHRNTIQYAQVKDHTGSYQVPEFLIKTKLPKINKKSFRLDGESSSATFDEYTFNFPCDYKKLTREQAVKMAKWVLKVGKD